MPRGSTQAVMNNFSRGLITEGTVMNFPENAVSDAINCIFHESGEVTRRLGIDYEPNSVIRNPSNWGSGTSTDPAIVEYVWKSAGEDGGTSLLAQQYGASVRFFFVDDSGAVSRGLLASFINLPSFSTFPTNQIALQPCQFTEGDNYLFIAHPLCDPIYVEYSAGTNSVSGTRITMTVRDISGVDDGLAIDQRPLTLSNRHRYNLFNQGWDIELTYRGSSASTRVDGKGPALNIWRQARQSENDWPSNADIAWLGRGGLGEVTIRDSYSRIVSVGNTPAPKGHYVYNAFNMNRSSVSGIPGLPTRSTTARPAAVCWYAGRVWYGGIGSNDYSSTLYYSQFAEGEDQFGKCYQINDPTSEHLFDILDTDGGTLSLPLVGKIVAIRVLGDALIVLGTNAVYSIRGADNGPFRSTDYVVNYIGPHSAVSHLSVLDAGGSLIWWGFDGIYALQRDSSGFNLSVVNMSQETIQSLLDEMQTGNIKYVKGVYNQREKIARWVYSNESEEVPYRYNRVLDFNTISSAFYPHEISDSTPKVAGLFSMIGARRLSSVEDVLTIDEELVTTTLDDPVQIESIRTIPNQEVFKFTVVGNIRPGNLFGLTYAEFSNEGLSDWPSVSDTAYESSFLSGYISPGGFATAFNSTPVTIVVKYFEGGRALVYGRWDHGFRESTPEELYLTRPEVDHLIRRVKIRGKGKVCQVGIRSVENNPFEIIGWNSFLTGGQVP